MTSPRRTKTTTTTNIRPAMADPRKASRKEQETESIFLSPHCHIRAASVIIMMLAFGRATGPYLVQKFSATRVLVSRVMGGGDGNHHDDTVCSLRITGARGGTGEQGTDVSVPDIDTDGIPLSDVGDRLDVCRSRSTVSTQSGFQSVLECQAAHCSAALSISKANLHP
ncbi:hypothetical protein ZHAS_00021103 [Anopheles sinensis]|uniref:Uncharacterized protein n=1 Tax=Anopheles sinensis TaxID=74873 RepID=A0A084WRJ0_ANOSI|nr:hypothetical protein ZHAS_00021103 [Anopheles sinensis]